jgi:hypothetical protein
MAAPIGARSQEVREGFVGALLRDSTQNLQFRLCCPAKSSPNCPVVLASGATVPSKCGQDQWETNWQRKGNYAVRLLARARKNLAHGPTSMPKHLESRTDWNVHAAQTDGR